jgi:tripartite motif-containing protein 71
MTINRFFFIVAPSYNQPKISLCATWNPNAITFATTSTVGFNPAGIFVDINNTVYVAETQLNRVQVWSEGSVTPVRTISGSLQSPYAVFASITGDLYVDDGQLNHRVDKWILNATNSIKVMSVTDGCYGLFIDTNNYLYCSMNRQNIVIKQSLNNGTNTTLSVGGTGSMGSASNELRNPQGIFVDINFNLYVADCGNNRIQFFESGQSNAVTVAGNGATGTITLNNPTAVVLDANGYLFITDSRNNRIVRSGPNGFQCLLGCTGGSSSASNQLNNPQSLSFDSYGNLFVVDTNNNRIQKFVLTTNSCGKHLIAHS